MRIIVTGGAGFIGSNLVHELNAAGERDILVVDNGSRDGTLALLRERGIACERAGRVDASTRLRLASGGREAVLWDLAQQPFTGFGPGPGGPS